jgi:hypothetical protein
MPTANRGDGCERILGYKSISFYLWNDFLIWGDPGTREIGGFFHKFLVRRSWISDPFPTP